MCATLRKLACLIAAIAICLTAAACRTGKTGDDPASSSVSTSGAPSQPDTTGTDTQAATSTDVTGYTDSDPTTPSPDESGLPSYPEQGGTSASTHGTTAGGGGDSQVTFPTDTQTEPEEEVYTSPIQMEGTSVDAGDSLRTIQVEPDNVVFEDFQSTGANLSPGPLTAKGMTYLGMNDVYWEVEKKRLISASPQYIRFLFPVDYIITDTEPNPRRTDWQNNADYINYKNGVYDFESEAMQAVYKYLDVLKDCGSRVQINFGWVVSARIQSWFSVSDIDAGMSAPADLELFGKACAALMQELLDRGYTNVVSVSLYNEMNGGAQITLGASEPYYVSMVKNVDSALRAAGIRDKVQLLGPEVAEIESSRAYVDYVYENARDQLDALTGHCYYRGTTFNYPVLYDIGNLLRNRYAVRFYLSEFNTGNYDWNAEISGVPVEQSEGGAWAWNNSAASFLIGCANTGIAGAARWAYCTQYWTDPLGFGSHRGSYQSLWLPPCTTDMVNNGVLEKFYEESILTNYVKAGSDVLMVKWEGQDTRVAAFRLPDGNYTIVVEMNEADSERKLDIQFDRAIGKTFYKMVFNHRVEKNGNALVPRNTAAFQNVGKSLTDTVGAEYATYVYTTARPIKQVELNQVTANCTAGSSVQFRANLVDCDNGDSIEWSIAAATDEAKKGSVDHNGVYTADTGASAGSTIAVKAALKSNPKVYAIAVVTIQ